MPQVGRLAGIGILGATVLLAPDPHGSGRICETLSSRQARVTFHDTRFDLREREDLRRLAKALDEELRDGDRTKAKGTDGDSDSDSGGKSRRALEALQSLTSRTLTTDPVPCEALGLIAEIADSLRLGKRPPVRERLDIVEVPFYYLDMSRNPMAEGATPAANLGPGDPLGRAVVADLSLRDPLPSTFWSRPKDIGRTDVYHAFGPILRTGDEACIYEEPKTSYGTTPGFNIRCGKRVIKVKFGAVKFGEELKEQRKDTEVALSRLFGTLGYHVEPNDYAPEVRIRYDRRILLEFNSRKDLSMTITALGFIPVYRVRVQAVLDPFRYVRSAVLKNGSVLSSEELARRLIRNEVLDRPARAARKSPRGTLAEHYREDAADFERQIATLIMMEANIQLEGSGGKNLGPWGWDRLDHAQRRELRGAGLLAAWTNYFDVRWDNNRLKLTGEDRVGLRGEGVGHFISDLGGGLGRAESFKVDEGNLVNDFPWTFTEAPRKDRKGRETSRFRIVQYQPIFENGAFRAMTVDDARWMARLIAQLTENQIEQALIACGFTSAEVKLFTEKLISRRDTMIKDLGLAGEIPLLRPKGSVRVFNYDPLLDGPVRATCPDGSRLAPATSPDLVVRGGRVVPR